MNTPNAIAPPRKSIPLTSLLIQLAVLILACALVAWFVGNASTNLKERGLASGFAFIHDAADFGISEGLVSYETGDSYLRAFAVGVSNSVRAAVPAMVLATVLGFFLGVAQISRHPLIRKLGKTYVDVVRNVPLLIQILLWYFLLTETLPSPQQPLQWMGLAILSKAGLAVAAPTGQAGLWWLTSAAIVVGGCLLVWPLFRWGKGRMLMLIALACIVWLGLPLDWEVPTVGSFGVNGGATLSTEWLALVAGLTLYTASYCAEIVRAGLQAVPRGQWEAAHALGLTWRQTLVRVVLPQSLRVMVPPYTSTLMSTLKNSSLAIVVGYPDIVSVATTSLNQTGQAIECIAIIALVYLSLNLITSLVMAWVNARVQIKER
ncbi:MAG: ABC transporter permease subunit [Rhizobacter sp.]|jgi:general L-amino acid transport system permease protein